MRLATWRARLEFLQKEAALAVDPDVKFGLDYGINEAKAKNSRTQGRARR
jgi:hypothetical protein